MDEETIWKIVELNFPDQYEVLTLERAEHGITGRYLSFISHPPKEERRRVNFSVSFESNDGKRHRELTGKVIRGLNETTVAKIIKLVNDFLLPTGKTLRIARSETSPDKVVAIYKICNLEFSLAHDAEQTPTKLDGNPHLQNLEVTAITER